jgi:hypothetical protein
MKKTVFPPAVLLLGLAFLSLGLLSAAEKTLTLPKGTRVEKLGAGKFRFVLPNGQKAEIKGYDPRAGIIGDCGVYDKGKLIMKGNRGNLIGVVVPDPPSIIKVPKEKTYVVFRGELANLKTLSKVPKSDYVMIDDEVTWLPATIQFKPEATGKKGLSPQPDPPGMRTVKLPKGTTAEKVGQGHFKFSLPNAQAVEVKNYNPKTGIIGDCGVYDRGKLVMKGGEGNLRGIINPDPPTVIRAPKEKVYVLFGGDLVDLRALSRIPKSNYVMIDDEVTWLPAIIRFN